MKTFTEHQRLWFYRVLSLLVTAVLAHLLTVWAAPRVIMQVLMHGPQAQTMNMHNQAAFPEPVSARSRSVVMPSPDMLYSVCAFDLSEGPVRIQTAPVLTNYWSVALYASNSDNFFVRNDRQAQGEAIDLWLVPDTGDNQGHAIAPGAEVVVSPSRQGFLLMRVLTSDYARESMVLETARRTLRCNPA
ncbi:MAG: DUF1254 domain-containing protein [Betaproteobacteria bacterium]